MKRVATIILNRNLQEVTDQLYEKLDRNDGDLTDIYVKKVDTLPSRGRS